MLSGSNTMLAATSAEQVPEDNEERFESPESVPDDLRQAHLCLPALTGRTGRMTFAGIENGKLFLNRS
jgi:hypothetical protein